MSISVLHKICPHVKPYESEILKRGESQENRGFCFGRTMALQLCIDLHLESIVHQSIVHYLCTKLRYLTNWTLDMAIFFDIATLEHQIQQFFTTCFSWWRANLLIFYRTLLSHYCSPHHFTYFLGPVILAAVFDNEVLTLFRSSVWIDNSTSFLW